VNQSYLHMRNLHRILLLTILLAGPVIQSRAQEPAAEPEETQPETTGRIVDGRPAMYSFKRAIHPLTWLEVAVKPVFRSAESGRLNTLITRKPDDSKVSGVKFGVDGDGTGS